MKRIIAGLLIVLCAMTTVTPLVVQAQDRSRSRDRYRERSYRRGDRYRSPEAAAGRFLGGLFGSYLREREPPVVVERPVIIERPVVAPWSREWLAWCAGRYKSFNPSTGQYFGYDGQYHFCPGPPD
jgi:hypothetical protein